MLWTCNVSAPPVDVLGIVRQLGVSPHFVRKPQWDGAADSFGEQAHIYVNVDQPPSQLRFTLAHELAHLLLHETDQAYRDIWALPKSSPADVVADLQANSFAANLLLPRWLVHAFAPSSHVCELSRTFLVSTRMMEARLLELDYHLI